MTKITKGNVLLDTMTPEELADSVFKLKEENARLQKEVDEQCRLNGMGSEREAKLLTQNRQLKDALEHLAFTVDDALLLDHELAEAWDDLFHAVQKAQEVLDQQD